RVLFSRGLNNASFDKEMDNYMDRPELAKPLEQLVHSILLNKVTSKQVVTMADGSTAEIELPVETYETHLIDQPLRPVLAKVLGVADSKFYLNSLLTSAVAKGMVDGPEHAISGRAMADSVKVVRRQAIDGSAVASGVKSFTLSGETLIASPVNKVAYEAL